MILNMGDVFIRAHHRCRLDDLASRAGSVSEYLSANPWMDRGGRADTQLAGLLQEVGHWSHYHQGRANDPDIFALAAHLFHDQYVVSEATPGDIDNALALFGVMERARDSRVREGMTHVRECLSASASERSQGYMAYARALDRALQDEKVKALSYLLWMAQGNPLAQALGGTRLETLRTLSATDRLPHLGPLLEELSIGTSLMSR